MPSYKFFKVSAFLGCLLITATLLSAESSNASQARTTSDIKEEKKSAAEEKKVEEIRSNNPSESAKKSTLCIFCQEDPGDSGILINDTVHQRSIRLCKACYTQMAIFDLLL